FHLLQISLPRSPPLFPYTTLFRSRGIEGDSGRLTGEAEWKKTLITDGGLVITPLLAFQADANYANASTASLNAIDAMAANPAVADRKSTRLNSSHVKISYAVFCLK